MAEVPVHKTESFWDQIQKMEDRVMSRAHEIFCETGSVFGKELDHWLAAERELVWKPVAEVREKDNCFEVKIDVAGIDSKDLKIEVTAEDLLVKGETRTEKKEEKGEIHTSEFQSGSLFRSIHLPKKVDPNKVKADLKNGLLTVTAPIADEAKARKIDIHAA